MDAVTRLTAMWHRLDRQYDNLNYKLGKAKEKLAERPNSKPRNDAVATIERSMDECRQDMRALHLAVTTLKEGAVK